MIKVTLKDGKIKEFNEGISFNEVVKDISISLAKEAIVVKFNNELLSLNDKLLCDGTLEVITNKDKEALDILNHSTAHLLAHAIKRLYPGSMFGIGPTIEEGFYYDIDIKDANITINDLPKIEKEMHKIADENISIIHTIVNKSEALAEFNNDVYKQEIINDIEDDKVNIYTQGDYKDVCRGPHVISTSKIKHFKLLNVAGAYWRGDSDNKMLTRIYGISFFKATDLEDYLKLIEERKERDHRKIGKDLDLFMISEYGPGFPFWLPKGMLLKNALTDFWMDIHTKAGYQFIQTPIMLNRELWETSGHWFNYKENMYTSTIDDKEFAIKPMNCPGGMLVYKNSIHSYRDLPLRLAELGLVHRHEASGALSGLFRVRSFTQDDAHIFMTEEQITDEIASIINLYKKVYDVFGLSFHIELSTRPEKKYIGDIAIWDKTEKALADACHKAGFDFKVNPGDGAFYGPKLDFKLRDSMNRIWQCGTIQLDMNLPERFDLHYIDADGNFVGSPATGTWFYNTLAEVSTESDALTITTGSGTDVTFGRSDATDVKFFKPFSTLGAEGGAVTGDGSKGQHTESGSTLDPVGKLMAYCYENATDVNHQIHGLSTGIAFVARMYKTNTSGTLSNLVERLYLYNDNVYESLAAIQEAYGANTPAAIVALVEKGDATVTEDELEKAGIERYNDGVCYYYTSRIKHFDNGKDNDMGNMEFAIMRNNIYSIAVSTIRDLGSPSVDKTPGVPNESSETALELNVMMMPWIVRYNDIEF